MQNACFKRGLRRDERHRTRAGIIANAVIAAVSFAFGCDSAEEKRGQLVITFQTDMALPTQIDNVEVQLTRRGGNVLLMQPYSIGGAADDNPIPGSLALVAGEQPEPITITVAGSKNGIWRTYREVITTVPRERIAELRMPIQWLCNESAKPQVATVADGKGGQISRIVQNCDEGYTCKAGSCVSSETDSASLPDFDPKQLYGGAEQAKNGACFDVLKCMAGGVPAEPAEDCTIQKPVGENVNVALRVAGGGICNESGPATTCFVPLDAEDPEGWTTTPDGLGIQLPEEVCARYLERKVIEVLTSTSCQMKLPSLPPCGAWSAVPDDHAIIPMPTTSPVAPSWPSPEVFISLPADNAELCCPLMSEGNQLFSCMCTNGKQEATVYAVDMQSARRQEFPLSERPSFAASVSNQTLYWSTDKVVFSLPLQAGATPSSFMGKGTHYTNVLLTDATGVHVLTSGLGEMPGGDREGVVQLLNFAYSGDFMSMDALGNRVVRQFTQDATAFYAIKNLDDKRPEGEPFERVTSVVRIDKATHEIATLLNPQTMTITDLKHSGFVGVVSDGTDTFALFETAPLANIEHLQIIRVTGASTAAASDPQPIFDLSVSAEKHLTSLRLLGAVDGAVMFARDEWAGLDRLRSSSVMVIPRGTNNARFVADFSGDVPVAGVAASGTEVFWLNQSGRIFALSREALAP